MEDLVVIGALFCDFLHCCMKTGTEVALSGTGTEVALSGTGTEVALRETGTENCEQYYCL